MFSRLHKHIRANPNNWTNCFMFIQDLANHSLNVTAEIPEKDAAMFQKLCLQYHKILAEQKNVFGSSGCIGPTMLSSKSATTRSAPTSTSNIQARSNGDKHIKNDIFGDQFEDELLHEAAELLARSQTRIEWENKILHSLISLLKSFDPMLKLEPIGSSIYGFGGSKTNFNVFINTSKYSMQLKTGKTQHSNSFLSNLQ